jgi:DNA repair exonuclease SbcCD ATPase subunit
MSRRFVYSFVMTTVVICSQALAQDPAGAPRFHSRSEHLAQRRKVEAAFPEVIRALRTLHLSPDKINQAEARLQRSEMETRAAREELQSLTEKQQGQDHARRSGDSTRVAELRANLQRSTEQLHSDVKQLLTPQQRAQYDKQLQHGPRARGTKSTGPHS